MEYRKLQKSFFLRKDTLQIAKELLGKYLLTDIDGAGITGGKIVEVEAYLGKEDKASHGYNGRRTKRNRNLYREGGGAYVYFCYGIYYLFNAVTGKENTADAVLIRAIEPTTGADLMLKRKMEKNKHSTVSAAAINRIASGPGLLTIALGINLRHDGTAICNSNKLEIWIEDRGTEILGKDITAASRVGVDYAEEYASLPWRFKIRGNKWVSK
ncbi:DNA-3-methyladenine glycosylase [Candidatus Acidulodesulfobacterium sp. H_13]|uniref:DNA-3-methyladenine glycosylase n=1 Tax=Candidatus Acidulodesulfobacterium sp. H_13 TaxID=3395470 RepID=UPI003AF656B1